MRPSPRIVLLPGLDGTGRMFRPLLEVMPAGVPVVAIAYPTTLTLSHGDLVERVAVELAGTADGLVLVGESYSGTIALRLASKLGPRVAGVVLIASFVENPTRLPRWTAGLVPDWLFRIRIPRWLLRFLLIGQGAPDPLVDELAEAISAVRPAVLAARVREVIRLRAADAPDLSGLPVLYIRANRDRLVSRRAADTARATRARLDVRELDAPHLVAQREPHAVWSAMSDWLSSLP